jgi:hypothetical protein
MSVKESTSDGSGHGLAERCGLAHPPEPLVPSWFQRPRTAPAGTGLELARHAGRPESRSLQSRRVG